MHFSVSLDFDAVVLESLIFRITLSSFGPEGHQSAMAIMFLLEIVEVCSLGSWYTIGINKAY